MSEQKLKKLSVILGVVLLAEIALLAVPVSMNIFIEMIEGTTMRIPPLLFTVFLIIYVTLFGFILFQVPKTYGGKIATLVILITLTVLPFYPLFYYTFALLFFRRP
jgi:hypothetical protein